MICPHCFTTVSTGVSACGQCGCNLDAVQQCIGRDSVTVGSLIDHGACLGQVERRELTDAIDAFERRFPQVACTVFLGGLPAGVNSAEAAFWLVNHAVFLREGGARSAVWALVLIIDPGVGESAIGMGYALEAVMPVGLANSLLAAAAPHLLHREYVRAIQHVLGGIDPRLRRLGRERLRGSLPAQASNKTHLGLPTPSSSAVGKDLPRARQS